MLGRKSKETVLTGLSASLSALFISKFGMQELIHHGLQHAQWRVLPHLPDATRSSSWLPPGAFLRPWESVSLQVSEKLQRCQKASIFTKTGNTFSETSM